ncbi:hypothetical protein JCM10213_000127 [Rhodosporidiobolus nylandii]
MAYAGYDMRGVSSALAGVALRPASVDPYARPSAFSLLLCATSGSRSLSRPLVLACSATSNCFPRAVAGEAFIGRVQRSGQNCESGVVRRCWSSADQAAEQERELCGGCRGSEAGVSEFRRAPRLPALRSRVTLLGTALLVSQLHGTDKACPQTPSKSPFLAKAPILDSLPPDVALALARLASSLEALAAQYPARGVPVQHHPRWGEAFFSWVKLLLPPFDAFIRALSQLREIAEGVWRAAGGFIAASNSGPVTVDVETADPEGGTHTVTGRERLAPLSSAQLAQTVEKLRMNSVLFTEVERAHGAATQRLLDEAERFMAKLLPLERMTLQTAPQVPGGAVPRVPSQQHAKTLLHAVVQLSHYPRQFYQVLGPLSSDPSIASGIWYSPSEAHNVFRAYRRVDSTLTKALVQARNAWDLMNANLQRAGYLPPEMGTSGECSALGAPAGDASGMRRAQIFPSLAEKVPGLGSHRPRSAGGYRATSPGLYPSSYLPVHCILYSPK